MKVEKSPQFGELSHEAEDPEKVIQFGLERIKVQNEQETENIVTHFRSPTGAINTL